MALHINLVNVLNGVWCSVFLHESFHTKAFGFKLVQVRALH
jgi:hypothetical protein